MECAVIVWYAKSEPEKIRSRVCNHARVSRAESSGLGGRDDRFYNSYPAVENRPPCPRFDWRR